MASAARYNGRVRFRLRDSHKEDFEQLWKLDQECFPPGISYTRVELAFYMRRPRAFTLVAERGPASGGSEAAGGILGFIVGETTARGAGHIITIDVQAEARRHRVGSALLQAAEERARQSGSRHMFLETAVNNAAAIAFYKRHGYDLIKTIPRYYKDNLDALLLGKRLEPGAGSR